MSQVNHVWSCVEPQGNATDQSCVATPLAHLIQNKWSFTKAWIFLFITWGQILSQKYPFIVWGQIVSKSVLLSLGACLLAQSVFTDTCRPLICWSPLQLAFRHRKPISRPGGYFCRMFHNQFIFKVTSSQFWFCEAVENWSSEDRIFRLQCQKLHKHTPSFQHISWTKMSNCEFNIIHFYLRFKKEKKATILNSACASQYTICLTCLHTGTLGDQIPGWVGQGTCTQSCTGATRTTNARRWQQQQKS